MNQAEAWRIVDQVWQALEEDHARVWRGEPTVPPMLYARIKAGYLKDHWFYEALQICLLTKDPRLCRINGDIKDINRLGVHGAPTGVGERDGVLLNDNPYNPPRKRLWVYFSLLPPTKTKKHTLKMSQLLDDEGLIILQRKKS